MTTETDYRDAMVVMAGDELERLREREREAAIILATALACGDYKSQHAHWLKDAAVWLNSREPALCEKDATIKRLVAREKELRDVLNWLDGLGGLGYEKHARIRAALVGERL